MALPSTNLGISDIFYNANPALSSITDLSFLDIASVGYFSGPNGSNVEPYNYWGQSENSGANRIFGLSFNSGSNYLMGDFRGLTYFYDNSSFLVNVEFLNNLPANVPPTDNDVTITVTLFDSNFTYQYGVQGGSMVTTNGGTFSGTISQTTSPIIFRGYWRVDISAGPFLGAGSLVDITINGTAKVTNGTLNAGPTPTIFDSATYGTEDIAFNTALGGTGLLIDVTCHT